jgi:flagellar hook-length control protein FliK
MGSSPGSAGEGSPRRFILGRLQRARPSAADLKFLHRLRQTHFRNFKSKSGTRIICLLVPCCFRSSCQRVPQCITNFGSWGTSGRAHGPAAVLAACAQGLPGPDRPGRPHGAIKLLIEKYFPARPAMARRLQRVGVESCPKGVAVASVASDRVAASSLRPEPGLHRRAARPIEKPESPFDMLLDTALLEPNAPPGTSAELRSDRTERRPSNPPGKLAADAADTTDNTANCDATPAATPGQDPGEHVVAQSTDVPADQASAKPATDPESPAPSDTPLPPQPVVAASAMMLVAAAIPVNLDTAAVPAAPATSPTPALQDAGARPAIPIPAAPIDRTATPPISEPPADPTGTPPISEPSGDAPAAAASTGSGVQATPAGLAAAATPTQPLSATDVVPTAPSEPALAVTPAPPSTSQTPAAPGLVSRPDNAAMPPMPAQSPAADAGATDTSAGRSATPAAADATAKTASPLRLADAAETSNPARTGAPRKGPDAVSASPAPTSDETAGPAALVNAGQAPTPTHPDGATKGPAVKVVAAERHDGSEPAGTTALTSDAHPVRPAPFAAGQISTDLAQNATDIAGRPVTSTATPAASAPHGVAVYAAYEAAVPIAGLAVEIVARALDGRNRFEIRLDPPELGRIDVHLNVDRHGNVASRLVVERSETLDLLRRDAPTLERALESAGLKTSGQGLEFSLRDQALGREQADQNGASGASRLIVRDDEVQPVAAARSGYGRLLGVGAGIDIRV